MRTLLTGLALFVAGCEGCEFSFGYIPLEVVITPTEADATVKICDDEGDRIVCETFSPDGSSILSICYKRGDRPDCETVGGARADPVYPPPPGTMKTTVGWDGFLGCRYPELEITVEAPGCETVRQTVPRSRGEKDEPGIRLEIALDCEPGATLL